MTSILTAILISLALMPQTDTVRLDWGTYIGERPTGQGKLYDNERGLYIGWFDRAVISGRGIHFRPDGGKYDGNFAKGRYSGYGRYFMHTGAVICGEFTGGHANGLDTLYYPDGRVFIGIMQNNGVTSQGKTYRSAQAARARKPAFPDVELSEYDSAFLATLRGGEYDTPAVFKDGVSFYQAYIHPNFKVSESLARHSAVVHYEFTVGANGKIRDVNITSTTDNRYARELVRVIMRSPRWTPAKKDGKPVPYTIRNQRIVFNLPE